MRAHVGGDVWVRGCVRAWWDADEDPREALLKYAKAAEGMHGPCGGPSFTWGMHATSAVLGRDRVCLSFSVPVCMYVRVCVRWRGGVHADADGRATPADPKWVAHAYQQTQPTTIFSSEPAPDPDTDGDGSGSERAPKRRK
jgi:hypothetical protein